MLEKPIAAVETTTLFTALDSEGHPIFIAEAESGRKGYFCQDCKKELIARKGAINIHHYAHLASDVDQSGERTGCILADEA